MSFGFPTGMIIQWPSDTIPDGFLLCDGSTYYSVDYPELSAILSTFFSESTGTFYVPDLKGKSAIGAASDTTMGSTGGAKTVTLVEAELPKHSHSGSTTSYTWTHSHKFLVGSGTSGIGLSYAKFSKTRSVKDLQSNGAHSHTFTFSNTGGGQAHNNLAPYLVTNFIIKT